MTLNSMKKVDNFVSCESVAYPGCYLGVLANGQLKNLTRCQLRTIMICLILRMLNDKLNQCL